MAQLDTPGAKFRMTGHAEVQWDGYTFQVQTDGGPITVMVGDGDGARVYTYHPLSGWYLLQDMRGKGGTLHDGNGTAQAATE